MMPRITVMTEKKLVGMRTAMSFAANRTFELWRRFMPQRNRIINRVGAELYSLEVYPPGFFMPFSPDREFEKWAALEVAALTEIPADMESLIVPTGLYAVFAHKGPAGSAAATYEHIFRVWLPGSEYVLDDRPHVAVMGGGYRPDDPHAEEDIWIPVRPSGRNRP